MLPKKYRIPGRYRIQRVFEKGRKVRGRLFSLWYYPNPTGVRFAIVIPTRLKLTAVKRNRIRRRLYEMIRKNINFLTAKKYDVILMAPTGKLETLPFDTMTQEFMWLIKRIGIA